MNFKKYNGKIFGVQLNKNEQRALDQEINRQIIENDRRFDMDKESSILWMLHVHFGFGPKRLKKGVGTVLFRNGEVARILPDGTGR